MTVKLAGELKTRSVGKVSMGARVAPNTVDVEKRTVEIVWTTGARVLRGSYDPFYEELSLEPGHVRMGRLESGNTPLLDTHWRDGVFGVIGVVESATISGNEGRAIVRFAKDDTSDVIFQKVADGILKNVSVGYRVYKMELREESINELPIYRAIDWEPEEISMVPIGADADAGVRSAETHNSCEFLNPLAEERKMPSKKDEDKTEIATEVREVAKQPDLEAVKREAIKADRERSAGVQRLANSLDLSEDFAERHIATDATLDQIRASAFDEHERASAKPIDDKPRIENIEDQREKWQRGASNWMVTRASLAPILMEQAKKAGKTIDLDPGEFRGLTMLDLARESLQMSGVNTRGMSQMDMVGKALTHRSGYQTTSDFSVLLENVMHKSLMSGYVEVEDTWRRFCKVGSVSDFRAHNRYRTGSFGTLDTVGEHGEFRNKAIPDGEKETITAATKGNIVAISRQAIINDDMGAFNSIGTAVGRMAGLSIEVDIFALLALNAGLGPAMEDGNTLFHAAHNNIGGGAALTIAAIDDDRVLMGLQTGPGGHLLSLRPEVLLLAIGLGGLARSVNEAQYNRDAVGSLEPNISLGLFRDIVDTGRITGTRRYLFANPNTTPTLEVAFLNGQQSPYLEMKEGWSVDGTEWKVRLDYGVGAIDWRGAVTDAGV